jgi:hypothetical protein
VIVVRVAFFFFRCDVGWFHAILIRPVNFVYLDRRKEADKEGLSVDRTDVYKIMYVCSLN